MSTFNQEIVDLLATISLGIGRPWDGDPDLGTRLAFVQGGLDHFAYWGEPGQAASFVLRHAVEAADARRVRRADVSDLWDQEQSR